MPQTYTSDRCELLFFIMVYLLLFYDNSCVGILSRGYRKPNTARGGDACLFFILDYLLLFYR